MIGCESCGLSSDPNVFCAKCYHKKGLPESMNRVVDFEDDDPDFADLPSGTAALIAENQGLRASVAKSKRKVALANSRADEAEKKAREAQGRANELSIRLRQLCQRLQTALEYAYPNEEQ